MQARNRLSVYRMPSALLLTITLTVAFGAVLASSGGMVDAQSVQVVLTPSWSDFQPSSWVTEAMVAASVVVTPEQTTTPNADFRVRDGASATWTPWVGVASANVITNGYRLTTPPVGFSEGNANQVQFRLTIDQISYESGQFPVRVDRTPPRVTLTTPASGTPSGFMVSWSGQDTGSGLPAGNVFDISYRKNDSPDWIPWLSGLPLTDTNHVFGPDQPMTLQTGDRIGLRAAARDSAGLIGESPIMTTTIKQYVYLPTVLREYDLAPTWTRAGSGLNGQRLRDLAGDNTNPSILYAASQRNGSYKNTSCNSQWSNIGPQGKYGLSVLPDGNITMVGTFGNSLFRRQGSGPWMSIDIGNAHVWALIKGAQGKSYAGTDAGVFVSEDQGASWRTWSYGLSGAGLLIDDLWTDADNNLWAATYGGGIYRSPLNNTSNWSPVNNGLLGNALKVWSLAQHGNDMLAGTEAGVFRHRNDTWEPWGLPNQIVYSLAVSQDGIHFAGTRSGGVFMRMAAASNWSTTDAPDWTGDMLVHDLLISTHCNVILAATRDGVWKYPLR